MTTIADELLNDFEDSGDDEQLDEGLDQDGLVGLASANGLRDATETNVELDGDEEEIQDEDMEGDSAMAGVQEAEDEAETKARVEKMQLGAVGDVRSVAGLMKTLEPVLEVSHSLSYTAISGFTSIDIALTTSLI